MAPALTFGWKDNLLIEILEFCKASKATFFLLLPFFWLLLQFLHDNLLSFPVTVFMLAPFDLLGFCLSYQSPGALLANIGDLPWSSFCFCIPLAADQPLHRIVNIRPSWWMTILLTWDLKFVVSSSSETGIFEFAELVPGPTMTFSCGTFSKLEVYLFSRRNLC